MNANARPIVTAAQAPGLRRCLAFAVLAVGAAVTALRPAAAQEAAETLELASPEELYELVGPIALYPDDLVAIVLPASTYPLQIVQAARFLEDRKRDSSLKPDEEWDESIIALLNYPEVVELMNEDLDWTYDLGTAVLNQRADVLDAIQELRNDAYAAGNLRSDGRQTVTRENGAIVIKPANPQVIYVPYYEPREVVVYQAVPVYHYHPHRYAVYYYPYPPHYVFDTGFFWGVRSWFAIGWHTHLVHLYDWHYHRHPYFGWRYYEPFYVHNVYVNINVNRSDDHVWQPRHRFGGRPVVRGSEGRVYAATRTPRRGVLDSDAAATRTREGSVYRPQSAAAAGQPSATGTPSRIAQPRRGVPSGAYRERAAAATERATQTARPSVPAPTRIVPAARSPAAVRPRESAADAGGSSAPPAASRGTYRSGGGMSQALERRTTPMVSPRATERSTGMPREAVRAAPPPRAAAPTADAPGNGRGNPHASSGGGSYRGGSTRGAAGR